ncbi:MAG TPA: carboxypeptidase-like regulatory domain-containing protein [Pyrinomonadaceae bacterium]|nr:carboxypeptidase-like regulatory domain-containing protein [Pyrinomonadaceae bacterium]
MLNLTRRIFAAVILLVIVGIPADTRSQVQADKKERTGSVSGRVTLNGKAASGVSVIMIRHEITRQSGLQLRDVTDQDGNYRITGVSAGRYQVAPSTPALVVKADDNFFDAGGKFLLMAEGETVEGVDFALMRGAAITGKVTDASGQPLIEEPISIESADSDQRGSWNRFSMDQHTDDRGIFRIFGLPPGRYKVAAGLSADRAHQRTVTGRTTYKRTFHPNATDPAKATIVELAEGAEATGIDITVGQAVPGFAASGRIVHSETGRPIANAGLFLVHFVVIGEGHTGRNVSFIPRSNSQGEFRVENLVAGKYELIPSSDSDLRGSPVKFDIVDQDVSGLVVSAAAGASVAGTVIFDNPIKATDKSNPAQLYISAQISGEDDDRSVGRLISIKPDGAFRFGGLPAGVVQFSIGAFSRSDSGYRIVRIERDGNVHPNGIQIQDAEQVSGVRVVVGVGTATIRGIVKLVNGPLPNGARLHVQVKKEGERERPSHLRSPELDSRNTFLMERLAPGSYEITATVFPASPGTPPIFGSIKQVVNVTEGGVVDVTLNLELKQNPQP